MGNCCRRLCPQDEPDDHQLLLASSVTEPTPQIYNSFSVTNTEPITQSLNRDDTIREIIKVIESRVVDTCATEVNPIDSQEYAIRSKFYMDNIQHRPVGSPIYPVYFPRPTANPALTLATTSTDRNEVVSLRGLAGAHAKIVRELNDQKDEPILVTFG